MAAADLVESGWKEAQQFTTSLWGSKVFQSRFALVIIDFTPFTDIHAHTGAFTLTDPTVSFFRFFSVATVAAARRRRKYTARCAVVPDISRTLRLG